MVQKLKPSWMNNVVSIYAEENMSHFEKILVIQALHPEHLHTALSKWSAQQLGTYNIIIIIEGTILPMKLVYRSTEPYTTVLDSKASIRRKREATSVAVVVTGC